MIAFLVKEPMYGVPLRIVVGDYSDCRAYMKRKYNIDEPENPTWWGGFATFLTYEGGGEGFIWLPRLEHGNIDDVAILAHEILHICLRILDKVGIVTTMDNQEPICYLQEYFLRMVLKWVKRGADMKREEKDI